MEPTKIKFFKDPKAFRAWLLRHHASATELWVGYYKKGTGRPSITWPESVDEALCFGWIDGLRRGVDETSFVIRFTPRREKSIWSKVNTRRARALIKSGAMQPTGLAAFKARTSERSGIYLFEQKSIELDPKYAKIFRRNRGAWKFFEAQPPGYRKIASGWVVRAKQESTRLARLEKLIAHSAAGERIPLFTRWKKKA
jgi:uncharacterized protein YdeI (YjbR/CyaY-like superfamily)